MRVFRASPAYLNTVQWTSLEHTPIVALGRRTPTARMAPAPLPACIPQGVRGRALTCTFMQVATWLLAPTGAGSRHVERQLRPAALPHRICYLKSVVASQNLLPSSVANRGGTNVEDGLGAGTAENWCKPCAAAIGRVRARRRHAFCKSLRRSADIIGSQPFGSSMVPASSVSHRSQDTDRGCTMRLSVRR